MFVRPKSLRDSAILRGIALLVPTLLAFGCDDPPKCRTHCGEHDSGVDADLPDADLDAGTDAGSDAGIDAGPDGGVSGCANLPPGLYVAGSCSTLAPNVHPFQPRYVLWSDGAEKDRYYSLPANSHIDATNADYWEFPIGTIFWKTFSVGSGSTRTKVETRFMRKMSAGVGTGAWEMRTFLWNVEQNEVTEITEGMTNARQTEHDIPNAPEDCVTCHGTRDVALGFSALQLNHSLGAVEGQLGFLLSSGTISPLPEASPGVPMTANDYRTSANLPTAATATETSALGYLHVNCGNCHGDYGSASGSSSMRLFMPLGFHDDPVTATPPYVTTVRVASTYMGLDRIDPDGASMMSAIYARMNIRSAGQQMPPLGTQEIDPTGLAAISTWINAIP